VSIVEVSVLRKCMRDISNGKACQLYSCQIVIVSGKYFLLSATSDKFPYVKGFLWVSSYVNWKTYLPSGPKIETKPHPTTRNSVVSAQLLYLIGQEFISGLKRIKKYYSVKEGDVCNISQQPWGCLQY